MRLAVFELVKNAYDADARRVTVCLADLGTETESIVVTDDGSGMSFETIRDVWLVPGNEHRQIQREGAARTKLGRLPLGEKGLGRFSAHKLGNRIELVTRAQGQDECVVRINWQDLVEMEFLDEAPVEITTRSPTRFKGNATGTEIRIEELRPPAWTRGEVRRLQRQVTSMCSPFSGPNDFSVVLDVPGNEDWLSDLPDVEEILARAFYVFRFRFDAGVFNWSYQFNPSGLPLKGSARTKTGERLQLPKLGRSDRVVASADFSAGVGPITGEFHIFDRDREVLSRIPQVKIIEDYLDENGGVRVYRDGVRVYNYGEPGDDWLGLDLRRVNRPTSSISRNLVIGAVHLDLSQSHQLVEKTNREGFVENEAVERLKAIVLGALTTFEAERRLDKDRVRALGGRARPTPGPESVKAPVSELRNVLARRGLGDHFEPYLKRIESDFHEMQETFLRSSVSGMNLAVVFHEIERGVRGLHSSVRRGETLSALERQARDLMHLLDGFSAILRRDSRKVHESDELISRARQLSRLRFKHHRIKLHAPEPGGPDNFKASFAFNLVLGALTNLVDNAIHWLQVRWPDEEGPEPSGRLLHIGASRDLEGGPCIVVADNGPGFQDEPRELTRPFFTRKPDGMGLGLYYANLVMELTGGRVLFPAPGDVDLPEEFDGAVVALQFPEEKN